MFHIMSFRSSQQVLDGNIENRVKRFGKQTKVYAEKFQIGGKRDHYLGGYRDAEEKYFVVKTESEYPIYLEKKQEKWSWYKPTYELVDDIDQWQEEQGINIEELNHEHIKSNADLWLVDVNEVKEKESGRYYYVTPFEVGEDRFGRYAVYEEGGVLKHLVDINKMGDFYLLFDKVEAIARNFTIQELVEQGYITVDDQMSWLGQNGKKIHAVVSYYRHAKDFDKYIYFRLDTWCSGNHWQAREHNPIAEFPNGKVTCKKCLKRMEKNGVTV